MRSLIILFAKAPVPGRVKTRLSPVLDAAGAAGLHSALVRDMLEALAPFSATADIELSTDIETDAWRDVPVSRSTQAEGSLGDRICHALAAALQAGRPKAMILGSDSPGLPAAHIDGLLQSTADAALGPTEDGGYYAIACRRAAPAMFRGVNWSTSSTLDDTVRALRDCGLTVELGLPWFDIDQPSDLYRMQELSNIPRHTADWLRSNARLFLSQAKS
ncbi:MAG: TIGR04282 family arsenosugar biosynthesis glycosyltransferase [Acidobacteria bacterium]|nr:TIGR04282 family arsenosugar biosynthesis glycosyltransferase [Acidobacteriota bacterium]